MAQHDYVIANQGFPAFRSDLNDALAAIVSNNSGATEPTTMFAHQMWVDTAADPSILKIRNADNDAWITIGSLNQTADTFTLTSAVSATTLNTSGAVVFNDAGADVDFRVEGDTDANLLFVDASADSIGIGTSSPNLTSFQKAVTLGDGSGTATRYAYEINGGQSSADSSIGDFNVYNKGSLVSRLLTVRGSADNSGVLTFYTSNAGTSAERLRITSAGAVGIGTSSPSEKLHVNSGAGNIPLLLESTDAVVLCSFKDNSTTTDVAVGAQSDALVFYSGSERMRIDSSGNLLVGTTTVTSVGKLQLTSSNTAYGFVDRAQVSGAGAPAGFFNSAGSTVGSITTNNTATTYSTSSDYRLKENVAPMTGALAKVLELNPVTYTWKVDGSAGEGFIAHELQAVCSQAVTGEKDATEIQQVEVSPAVPATYDDDGNELTPAVEAVYEEREVPKYQGVDTSFLVATLTAAIQELSAKNDALESRIAALENA